MPSQMRSRYMPFKMTLANFSTLTLLLFILFACNQTSNHNNSSNKSDTTETTNAATTLSTKRLDNSTNKNDQNEKIVDTIFKLTEVKERGKYIEQQTKGKRHLQVWIGDTPSLKQPYYYVQVGEDNGTNFVTHFNFYVYPDSMRIMFYDTVNDSTMTLAQWRKINGM